MRIRIIRKRMQKTVLTQGVQIRGIKKHVNTANYKAWKIAIFGMHESDNESMIEPLESLEDAIRPAIWEDKDTDLVTQYEFNKKILHIEDVDKLG